MIAVRKKIAFILAGLCMLSCTACSGTIQNNAETTDGNVNYTDLVVGEDYLDLKAKINIFTNRTDLIQGDRSGNGFQVYIDKFNQLYPNIEISYEGLTNYDEDMIIRLPSGGWGDICCIPANVSQNMYPEYFEPIAKTEALASKYEFVEKGSYENIVYGISSGGNVQGIIYNKQIWEEAGITELPATPEDFLQALQQIADNTNAIPLYTNSAARWPLTAWDSYTSVCATGDATYKNQKMPFEKNPFENQGNGTGIYEVYRILYESIKRNLIEDDPYSTSWEDSKAMLNEGTIATMVLGSWAIPQVQDAGSHPENVGYMPFPISVDGKQYANASSDYCYGINSKISDEKKIASMLYLKFLTEESGFAYDQGSIPVLKGEAYPDVLSDFENAEILMDAPALEGQENAFLEINETSGLCFTSESEHVERIVQAALNGTESFDDIMNDWNKAWTTAQENDSDLAP